MRRNRVGYGIALLVHGVLVDTIEHVERRVSHALLSVLWRDLQGSHDGRGVVAQVVKATGEDEL